MYRGEVCTSIDIKEPLIYINSEYSIDSDDGHEYHIELIIGYNIYIMIIVPIIWR